MFGWLKKSRTPTNARQDDAVARLDSAAEGFRTAAEACGPPQSPLFWQLAGATSDLRNRVKADPDQITPLRKLIFHFIPQMSRICQRWAGIAARNPLAPPDSKALEEFAGYLDLIRAAEQSCLTQSYEALHLSMEVMEEQMERYSS